MSLMIAMTVFADDWVLVGDASTLQAGDKLVIACNTQGATAGAYDASVSGLSIVQSVFSSAKDFISSLGSGTLVFVLGGQKGAWTLAAPDGQLLASTGSRKLQVGGSGTNTWSISISNGNAVIDNTNPVCGSIQYNASASPRFYCHTAKQTPVQLYRQTASGPKVRLSYQGFPYKRTGCEYPSYSAGSNVKLAVCPLKNAAGEVVIAWKYNDQTYEPGGLFTMPEEDVELVPVWGEPQEGIETVRTSDIKIQKVLLDGQLIIIRDGVAYTIMGAKVK